MNWEHKCSQGHCFSFLQALLRFYRQLTISRENHAYNVPEGGSLPLLCLNLPSFYTGTKKTMAPIGAVIFRSYAKALAQRKKKTDKKARTLHL